VAGGLGSAAAQSGCAHNTHVAPTELPLTDPETVAHVLRKLDERLAWIDKQPLPANLTPDRPITLGKNLSDAQVEALFRTSIKTLYITGRFMDLPDDLKVHPEMQSRILAAQPMMDDAVLGVTALLESLSNEDHRHIQTALRSRSDVAETLSVMLNEPAKEDGIPFKRRMELRSSVLSLAEKMTEQSPALTIDPYVKKVRKVESRPRTHAEEQRMWAAKFGEDAFWQHQQKLNDISQKWQQKYAQAGKTAPSDAPRPALNMPPAGTQQAPSKGHSIVSTGGRMMGFGAGSVALGLVFAGLGNVFETALFAWPALFFGVTVGPSLLMVGLLVVLVGGLTIAFE